MIVAVGDDSAGITIDGGHGGGGGWIWWLVMVVVDIDIKIQNIHIIYGFCVTFVLMCFLWMYSNTFGVITQGPLAVVDKYS